MKKRAKAGVPARDQVQESYFFRFRTGAFLLFLLALAVFLPALNGSFVLDDESEITQNPVVQSLEHLPTLFLGSTMSQGGSSALGGIYYRPLMMVTFSVIWNCISENPVAFHLVQILLHLGCAILLLALLRRWMTSGAALAVAALFLVHPLNVEPAVYISSLQDPLFLIFSLGALLILTREKPLTNRAVFFASGLFLCSLLSKETAALLMIVAAIYAYCFQNHRLSRVLVATGGATIVYAFMRFAVAGLSALKDPTTLIAKASAGVRLMTVPLALFNYVSKFVFPNRLAVTEDWVVREPTLMQFWLPLGACVAVGAAAYWVGRRIQDKQRRALYWLFLAWTGLGLFLHSHIAVPIDGTVSDRWFYMTSIGALACIAIAVEKLPRRSMAIVAGVFVFAFASRSFVRAMNWRDGVTLYAHDTESAPTTAYLPNNLGVELFRRGDLDTAKVLFEKSIALNDEWNVNWSNLGAIYQHRGDYAKAEECYARSVKNGPYLLAYENYATLLAGRGRLSEARQFLDQKGLRQFPTDPKLLEIDLYLRRAPASH